MPILEKIGLEIVIISLFVRQLTIFPKGTIAEPVFVVIFLAGWFLFLFGGED